jgi:hypothetical protein
MDDEIRAEFREVKTRLLTLELSVGRLMGRWDSLDVIIKYVVLPLLVIVGGLVGIRLF